MNPYYRLVSDYARHAREGKDYPLGGFAPAPRPALAPDAPKVLLFSPHPDDECIVGGLALRLLRQSRANVVNVAVTQGSSVARRAGRWAELEAACDYLGFGLVAAQPGGLEKVNPRTRATEPAVWQQMVSVVASLVSAHRPRAVVFPHEGDNNTTHAGTHWLVRDALAFPGLQWDGWVVETEFWGAMATPNLMVESSVEDVADLVTATSFHVGEVKRNPYHLLLPAWMQDNVRRGGELVGGQGQAAPDFVFATLYRLRRWRDGQWVAPIAGGRFLPCAESPDALFAS
jgi:LmbE family N-acetylglucosaminyl deacetylase